MCYRLAEEQGPGVIADQMLPKLLSPHASDEPRAKLRRMIEANQGAGIPAALCGRPPRLDAAAGDDDVPTAIIVGAEDSLTPPSDARAA